MKTDTIRILIKTNLNPSQKDYSISKSVIHKIEEYFEMYKRKYKIKQSDITPTILKSRYWGNGHFDLEDVVIYQDITDNSFIILQLHPKCICFFTRTQENKLTSDKNYMTIIYSDYLNRKDVETFFNCLTKYAKEKYFNLHIELGSLLKYFEAKI